MITRKEDFIMKENLKVLMLNGSPKANGNTAIALREMENVFKENGVEVETVVLETVKVKESDQDLVNQKAKLLKKEKAAEKAANPTPVLTKKPEPSSISFEDIKKHLLKPLPTIVPSFLRK